MRAYVIIALFLLLAIVLEGCAYGPNGAATSGGANYSYSKTPDGCSVTINSAREIAGADLLIGPDCSVAVTADSAGGDKAVEVIGRALELVK